MSSRASCGAITRFAGDGHKPVPNAGDGLDEAGLPPVVLQLGAERPDVPVDVWRVGRYRRALDLDFIRLGSARRSARAQPHLAHNNRVATRPGRSGAFLTRGLVRPARRFFSFVPCFSVSVALGSFSSSLSFQGRGHGFESHPATEILWRIRESRAVESPPRALGSHFRPGFIEAGETQSQELGASRAIFWYRRSDKPAQRGAPENRL